MDNITHKNLQQQSEYYESLLNPSMMRGSFGRYKKIYNLYEIKRANKQDYKKTNKKIKSIIGDIKKEFVSMRQDIWAKIIIGTLLSSLAITCNHLYINTSKDTKSNWISNNKYKLYSDVLLCILCFMIGYYHVENWNKLYAEDAFYHFHRLLTARYFKRIQQKFNLDETLFKQCNPQMADEVTKYLIANLSKANINVLKQLAINCYKLDSNTTEATEERLQKIENQFEMAISVLEKRLSTDPFLLYNIVNIYKGKKVDKYVLYTMQHTK